MRGGQVMSVRVEKLTAKVNQGWEIFGSTQDEVLDI